MRDEILAEKLAPAAAVEAFAAELGVVCYHSIADVESVDFRSECCDDADCFVAGDDGELDMLGIVSGGGGLVVYLCSELSVVDV